MFKFQKNSMVQTQNTSLEKFDLKNIIDINFQ
jgi:hypothetical protein